MSSKKVLSLVVVLIMLVSIGLPVVNAEEAEAPAVEVEGLAEEVEAPAEEVEGLAEEVEVPAEEVETHAEEEKAPAEEVDKWFCVQTGTFGVAQNALNQAIELYKLGFEGAFVYDYPENQMFYAMAGRFKTREEAEPVLAEVKKHAKYSGSWITERTNMADEDITEARPFVLKDWYCVQIGVYSTKEEAMENVVRLVGAGFEDAFMLFDGDTYNHWAMAGRFATEAEAGALKLEVEKKGFESFVTKRSFKDTDMYRPGDEGDIKSRYEEFMELVDELPDPEGITQIKFEDKVNSEKARDLYNKMSDEERAKIEDGYLEKLEAVEAKIQSLKTEIKTRTRINYRQAQAWAVKRGAHKRFVDIASVYWEYGELTGMRPEILYTQSGKETNFGKYTGAVKPEMNNWAGIKIADPIGDRTEDHETFATPEDGVRGHFNHMGIYCGVDPIGEPHPRWYKTREAEWAGTILFVEDLGGLWAPNPDYGISIVRDYMVDLYNTAEPAEGVLETALELSDRVEALVAIEEFSIYELKEIAEILDEHNNAFTEAHKAVIPYNIKEDIKRLRDRFNEKAVETVIDSIDKLPTPEKLTLEDRDVVEAIRIVYETLADEDKALVTNLERLEAAERRIAELEEEPGEPGVSDAVEKVIDLINELPELAELKLSHRDKVKEARAKYDALTDEEKALVTNLNVLEAAERRIAELEKSEKPEKPEEPEKPEKPEEPEKPEKPEEPGKPEKPESPEKPKDTQKLPKTGMGGTRIAFIGLILLAMGLSLLILIHKPKGEITQR